MSKRNPIRTQERRTSLDDADRVDYRVRDSADFGGRGFAHCATKYQYQQEANCGVACGR